MRDSGRQRELKRRAASWSLRRTVEISRKLNQSLSLHRALNDGGEGPIMEDIKKVMGYLSRREWKGIKFFQCPLTGYAVMRVPPFSFVEDFRELEEMAWEAQIENRGIGGADVEFKMRAIRKKVKRGRGVRRWCGCGCGGRVYGKGRWISGHNGRVEGWFQRGIIPPGFEFDYEKWRMTGCLAKLEELPTSGTT